MCCKPERTLGRFWVQKTLSFRECQDKRALFHLSHPDSGMPDLFGISVRTCFESALVFQILVEAIVFFAFR